MDAHFSSSRITTVGFFANGMALPGSLPRSRMLMVETRWELATTNSLVYLQHQRLALHVIIVSEIRCRARGGPTEGMVPERERPSVQRKDATRWKTSGSVPLTVCLWVRVQVLD